MRVLYIEPGKSPEVKEIPGDLASLQEEVGGYIEAVYPFEDPVAIICNEEGKLIGLPPNRRFEYSGHDWYDIICGTFLIVGLSEDNFKSLTDEEVVKYTDMFKEVEVLIE